MKVFQLICLVTLAIGVFSQNATDAEDPATAEEFTIGDPCPKCLFPIWYNAVNLNKTEICSVVTFASVFECLDVCDLAPIDKPESYRIRQLTQISDIFFALQNFSCPLPAGCSNVIDCTLNLSNFDDQGITSHAPYPTVFDYNCGEERLVESIQCLTQTTSCFSGADDRLSTLQTLINSGIDAACNNPRRCVKWANIFEVQPGSGCVNYFQEAAAYGPSTGIPQTSQPNIGFDPSICRPEFLGQFTCPADPEVTPIFSEFPPNTDNAEEAYTVDDVNVDLTLSCEKCLYPAWERAVTTNGSHLCDEGFISMTFSCLQACADKTVLNDQLHTETLVKIADLSKAFSVNGCAAPRCSSSLFTCTENLVNFYPISAPHVTVNSLICSPEALVATEDCFASACDESFAALLNSFVRKGYSAVCESDLRCMSYGNIYEYVPVDEVPIEEDDDTAIVPCANYRQAPANGWHVSAIARVQPGLVFNTNNCQPDWPANVQCPEIILNP